MEELGVRPLLDCCVLWTSLFQQRPRKFQLEALPLPLPSLVPGNFQLQLPPCAPPFLVSQVFLSRTQQAGSW